MMRNEHIRSTLAELKLELNSISATDNDSAESINQLILKLEQQLSEPEISDHQNLIDQLQLFINKFEINHPTLTSIANELMVKLASIGV